MTAMSGAIYSHQLLKLNLAISHTVTGDKSKTQRILAKMNRTNVSCDLILIEHEQPFTSPLTRFNSSLYSLKCIIRPKLTTIMNMSMKDQTKVALMLMNFAQIKSRIWLEKLGIFGAWTFRSSVIGSLSFWQLITKCTNDIMLNACSTEIKCNIFYSFRSWIDLISKYTWC